MIKSLDIWLVTDVECFRLVSKTDELEGRIMPSIWIFEDSSRDTDEELAKLWYKLIDVVANGVLDKFDTVIELNGSNVTEAEAVGEFSSVYFAGDDAWDEVRVVCGSGFVVGDSKIRSCALDKLDILWIVEVVSDNTGSKVAEFLSDTDDTVDSLWDDTIISRLVSEEDTKSDVIEFVEMLGDSMATIDDSVNISKEQVVLVVLWQ